MKWLKLCRVEKFTKYYGGGRLTQISFYSLGEGIDYAMWDDNGNQFRMSFAETFMQSISLSISYEDVDVVYVRCVKQ